MSLGLLNLGQSLSAVRKKVSTDRASMVLRKHEQSVLQSLCSIYKQFLDLFISLYAIHIHWKCAKLKKIKALKLEIINVNHTKLNGERWKRKPNSTQNIDCLHRGGMPL